jgi:hypothetical protein
VGDFEDQKKEILSGLKESTAQAVEALDTQQKTQDERLAERL